MPALSKTPRTERSPFKVVYAPPEEIQPELPLQEEVQQRTNDPLLYFGAKIARQFADRKVSDEDRRRAVTELTVPEFYYRFMHESRAKGTDGKKKVDPKTLQLDLNALLWFCRVGIPEGWPEGETWEGPPIGCVTSAWIASLVEESLLNGLAPNTIGKYLRHLRTIFNEANRMGLIPKLAVKIPSEEPEARPFTDQEVERIYRSLAQCPVLQVAFVVAIATGPRFADLFWLQWDQIDLERRQIKFTAGKTDKFQIVPLTNTPIRHLMRLPRYEAPFASLVDQSVPPDFRAEHYRSRMLNARWRALTGFPAPPRLKANRDPDAIVHPWHSARSTAGVWIERVRAGMATKLLGHGIETAGEKTTRIHYLVPLVPADLREAAEAVIWPPYFDQIIEPRQKLLF